MILENKGAPIQDNETHNPTIHNTLTYRIRSWLANIDKKGKLLTKTIHIISGNNRTTKKAAHIDAKLHTTKHAHNAIINNDFTATHIQVTQ